MTGLEFEGARELCEDLHNIVVGHVLSCEKHPDADRLSISCGRCWRKNGNHCVWPIAPNVETGQKVAVALQLHSSGNFK